MLWERRAHRNAELPTGRSGARGTIVPFQDKRRIQRGGVRRVWYLTTRGPPRLVVGRVKLGGPLGRLTRSSPGALRRGRAARHWCTRVRVGSVPGGSRCKIPWYLTRKIERVRVGARVRYHCLISVAVLSCGAHRGPFCRCARRSSTSNFDHQARPGPHRATEGAKIRVRDMRVQRGAIRRAQEGACTLG